MNTVVLIDSCSDLPQKYVTQQNLPVISLVYRLKGKEYYDDFGKTISYKEFYNSVRSGELPTTSQVNVDTFIGIFKGIAKEGKSVIYPAFSSALSGTYNSALIAKDMVLEEYPNADITVIDTKCASLGEGLIVYYIVDMLNKGTPKEDIVEWVENNKLKLNHWFTVEDLGHLKRGGRISGTAALIGTILDIKPVMHVNDEGRLIPVLKVKGRKKSLRTLFDKLEQNIVNPEEQVIAISHGDCLEDAQYLEELIRQSISVKDIIINPIGPVIGSHSGPGTVALFFLGKER